MIEIINKQILKRITFSPGEVGLSSYTINLISMAILRLLTPATEIEKSKMVIVSLESGKMEKKNI
jgi:hypothetical protein